MPTDTADEESPRESPSWASPEQLGKVLGAVVRDVSVQPLDAGDDYFNSAIHKVKVVLEKEEREQAEEEPAKHLIVKESLGGPYAAFYTRVFLVEARVYAELIPRMTALLRAVGKDQPPLAPRMLSQLVDPDKHVLYFEDIAVQGFRLAARNECLDVAHSRLFMRTIARWHASSSMVLQAQPELFKDMPLHLADEERSYVKGYMVKGFERFVRHVESWTDDLSRRTAPKLRRLAGDPATVLKRFIEAHRQPPRLPGANALSVGLHAELWPGNLLFKYCDNGQPVEMRLVDFQKASWGSLASDLLFFHNTMSGAARQRRDELLEEYHAELAECLRAMGAPYVPDLAEMKADILRRSFAEVVHVGSGMAMQMAPPSVGLTVEFILERDCELDGPHPKDVALEREAFRKEIDQYFAVWEREGLLEKLLAQHEI